MNEEKIKVRVTSSGQILEVVVLNKRLDNIQVVLGEGVELGQIVGKDLRARLSTRRQGTLLLK